MEQCACTHPGTEAVPGALPRNGSGARSAPATEAVPGALHRNGTPSSTMGTPLPPPLRKRSYLFFRLSINMRLLLHPLYDT